MSAIVKYKDLLDGLDKIDPIGMGEGMTPLIKSRQIGPSMGLENLYFKLESLNPTGSYKDRFGALAVSDLVSSGAKYCLATSSGNTGASLAAYSALAGIPCHIAVVDGAPMGKLMQMQAYGATLWMVKDFGIDGDVTTSVFEDLGAIAESYGTIVQISAFTYSPMGMQGVQTISYEIAEEMPAVRHVFVPAGGGGLTLAVARGFERWSSDHGDVRPSVHCVQPAGNDTIASRLRSGALNAKGIKSATTRISGLQVPGVIDGDAVIAACRRSGGSGYAVEDEVVFDMQKRMAFSEGIYCEPAGAVALAGAVKAIENHEIDPKEPIVCLVTGHGFKDPGAAERMIGKEQFNKIDAIDELKLFLDG